MVTVHTGSRPRPLLEPSLKEPSSQLVVVAAAVEPVVNTARSARSPAPSPCRADGTECLASGQDTTARACLQVSLAPLGVGEFDDFSPRCAEAEAAHHQFLRRGAGARSSAVARTRRVADRLDADSTLVDDQTALCRHPRCSLGAGAIRGQAFK